MASRFARAAALSACLLGSLSQAGAQVVTLPVSVPLAPAAPTWGPAAPTLGAAAAGSVAAGLQSLGGPALGLGGPASLGVVAGPQLSLSLPGSPVALAAPNAALPLGAPAAPAAPTGRLAAAAQPLESLAAGQDAGQTFDGQRQADPRQLGLPFPTGSQPRGPAVDDRGVPRYLSIANPEHASALAEMTRVASQSKTARRVFAQADRMARARGRPITVVFTDLRANNGEYVYDWDMLRMGAHYLNKAPIEAAATLVHELLHVVQKAQLLPVDAAELELEAYMVTFEVMRELGTPFEKGSFYKSAYRKFRAGSVPDFIRWMVSEYKGNIPLLTSRISAYVKELKARREKTKTALARWDRKIQKEQAAVDEMVRTGQDAKAIEVYKHDILGKLNRDRREDEAALGWLERDLEMLGTAEGRARYRAYARRVDAYMHRVHERYARS